MKKTILELEREYFITNHKEYPVIKHILDEFQQDYDIGLDIGREEGYSKGFQDAEKQVTRDAFDRGFAVAAEKYGKLPEKL
jgi:hypothetical protein